MESDKFICIRDTSKDGQGADSHSIVIVELTEEGKAKPSTRHRMNPTDATVMNPASKVLALRSGQDIQILNLDMKLRLKSTRMNEPVQFMKWISPQQMAIVTSSSVYHWSMEGEAEPVKKFERREECQILNYRTDETLSWLLLVGIATDAVRKGKGIVQLYSVDKDVHTIIDGHAACFCKFKLPGTMQTINLLCIASGGPSPQCFIAEVPLPNQPMSGQFNKVTVPLPITEPQDFPLGLHADEPKGLLYILCRSGWCYVMDVQTGTLIHQEKVSGSPENVNVFTSAKQHHYNGVLSVNTKGDVMLCHINEKTIVQWVQQRLNNQALALRIATSANLGGADDLFRQRFNTCLQSMQIEAAVKLCMEAPRQMLRTPEVLQRFQQLSSQNGQPALTVYFKFMVEHSKLNKHESVELVKVMLTKQQGIEFVKKYLNEKKLEESEELGDIIANADPPLALQIYYNGKAHWKVLAVLIRQKNWKHIIEYVKKSDDWKPDWCEMLERVVSMGDMEGASNLAQALAQEPNLEPPLDHNKIVEMFVTKTAIRPATAYLLEVLKDNSPEFGDLQTRLLEINLMHSPATVANKIFELCQLSHYDAKKIAPLCERAQLYQRALETYNKIQQDTDYRESTLKNLKSVIVNTHAIPHEWLVEFFQQLSKDDALACLQELMAKSQGSFRQGELPPNYKISVRVAVNNYRVLGTEPLINLFLSYQAFDAMYYFLGSIVRPNPSGEVCNDPEVHFRYIEAAANVNQPSEVERMTRESQYYPAEKTKNFLKEKRLADLWPFINVCDKHDYMDEMVRFLYDTKNLAYIDMYIQKKAPTKTPLVVGSLLDVGCNEDYIKRLIVSVGSMAPVEELVAEVEKRNRLKLLQEWLESRVHTSQDKNVYNALAKIYVDTNQNGKQFLADNVGKYDAAVVGKYCENRDPSLAVLCYERGDCDKELVEVTSRNGMFKHQSRYLVSRKDPELWEFVLESEEQEQYRKSLIDAVVATALPEAKQAEEVSVTVRAFMKANLPEHLTTLLEKIILHGDDRSEFRSNKYLQNLLVLTAIKATPNKVMDYVQRLEHFDAKDIAEIASKAGLYEEAFTVYKKQGMNAEAAEVLLQDIQNLDRARDFAEKVKMPEVYASVGRAELQKGDIPNAISFFIKADDASHASEVIAAVVSSGEKERYSDLVKFLNMARSGTKMKSESIDTELCYAYCVTNRLVDLEDFLKQAHLAKVGEVGMRCYSEKLYDAAKTCFQTVSNFPMLAKTHLKLGQYQMAIDAAGRTNSISTWKEVCYACVDAGEFRLAGIAAQNVVVVADELNEIIRFFEERGHIDELISLMKQGLTHERAHVGMFTELGILYAKYKSDKLMEHIKLWKARMNSHKLVVICEQYHHWAEIRYIHCKNEEWDAAARVMVDHSVLAWDHEVFKDTIAKVSSQELCYNGVNFYLEEHPDLVNDLLLTIIKRVDPDRIVVEVQGKCRTSNFDFISVVRPYLESVQEGNHAKVNEALNKLYIEEEDYESLKQSLENYDAVDQVELAEQLDQHDLLEMRRVASWLYQKNGKFSQAIECSKRDKLYHDATKTAALSGDKEVVEKLVRFFTDNNLHECFSACLYTCYEYIQPDVALELAWRHKVYDFAMPYIVQVLKEYIDKIDDVCAQLKSAKEQAAKHVSGNQMPQQTAAPLMISSQGYGGYQQNQSYGGY